MPRWVRNATRAGGFVVGAAAVAAVAGSAVWNHQTARTVARLTRFRHRPRRTFTPDQLAGLPAPVARYFAFVLTPGQPLVRAARLEQAGEFRARPEAGEGGWSPFTAVEHFAADPPGFVWDAKIRMAPLLTVRVRDAYLGGQGIMDARMGGLVSVAHAPPSRELATAALQRYLAEAAWIPTALLPANGVGWDAIDDETARATLTDSGVTVSLDFRFGHDGAIVSVHTDMRYREVDGRMVPTPWTGTFSAYRDFDGMLIPTRGEVAWELPSGQLPYWRGRIEKADYRF